VSVNRALEWLAMVLAAAAVACICALLASDKKIYIPRGLEAPAISAASLLLIGASLLIFQLILRPRWMQLLKSVMLSAAFILWGVVQLMKPSDLSKKLGDVVIALYVLELAWVIFAGVNPASAARSSSLRSRPVEE
jgi:peptidoglycan/LPS O-acetylase OafA/YrhL